MTALINRERREAARQALAERRQALLETARHLFATRPYGDITLAAIERQAGVPEGTGELLFASREQLFLDLMADAVHAWCRTVLAELANRPSLTTGELATLLARTLARHPLLTRCASQLAAAVERVVEVSVVWHFQHRVGEALAEVQREIRSRCPTLGPGLARVLPLWVFVLACGLEPLAHAAGGVATALVDPSLSDFAVDFETELAAMLTALLR